MNRKISLGLTVALMAISAAITFIISTSYTMNIFNGLVADVQQRAEMYQKLEQIDTYVRAYYDGTIDEDLLIEALAEGYISIIESADADYLPAQDYSLYRERLSGTHLGIGVYTAEDGGYPKITRVLANSPASAAGLQVGESIIEINGQSALDLGYTAAVDLLRSASGTQLELTVSTGGVDRTVSLTTMQMTIGTVSTKSFNNLGYIKITQFNEKTYQQFMAAYSMLTSSGVRGLILDVRNNSGELFDSTVNILGAMLPVDSTVAIRINRDSSETVYQTATGTRTPTVPLAILINSRTSGPAELFAAALKDHYGAQLIGTQTAGDGELFESYPLYDGTAIILPIATLRSTTLEIEGVGLKPDYDTPLSTDDSDDTLAYLDENTDPCIKKAVETLLNQIPEQDQAQ